MRPRSNGRGTAVSSARAARAGEAGIRRLPARRFPVPPGMSPSGILVPTRAAAACIVVPSPPNTATTLTPLATPYSASSLACPGPPVARTSTSQPPPLRALATAPTEACAVRAAMGLAISSARVTSEFALPVDVGADLIRNGGLDSQISTARLQTRLDAGFQAPFPAETELEAGTEIVIAELAEIFRAEAGIQCDECLAPELPSGGELGERLGTARLGHAGPNLEEIEGDPEILNERALQLAGDCAGEIGKSGFQRVSETLPGSFVRRKAGHDIGHQIGLRNGWIERALQRDFRRVQGTGNVGDHRNFLASHRAHNVGRADVEPGLQVAEVTHRSSLDGKVAGHRTDLEGIAAPQRIERSGRRVGLSRLAELHFSTQLDIGFGRAEPNVGAEHHPQVLNCERVQKAILELGSEIFLSEQGGIDQIRDGGVFQIDNSLADEIGKVQDPAVGVEIAGQGGAK